MLVNSLISALGRMASFLGAAILLLGGGGALVWPLWYLATKRRDVFNLSAALLCAGLILCIVVRALVRRNHRRRIRRGRAAFDSGR
ncbi:MAG: hypothetical protein ACLQMF_14135 [Rectinemataceae bacterium]